MVYCLSSVFQARDEWVYLALRWEAFGCQSQSVILSVVRLCRAFRCVRGVAHPHQSTWCFLSSVKIKDRNDASDLDWHKRKKLWINISHKCLDSWAGFMATLQTYYPRLDLYIWVWQIKDSFSAQVSNSSTALSDLIYSITSMVASSSTLQCHHSVLDVSTEQRDIKQITIHIQHLEWTQGLGFMQNSTLAMQLTVTARSHALKKTYRKFPAYAFAYSGEVGQLATEYTGLGIKTQRNHGDRHYYCASITDSSDSFSLLTAEEQKAGWMQLSDALLLQSESSSLTDTDGGTDWLCAHEQHSVVVFNCGSTWNSLLKVPPLLFAAELISQFKKKKNETSTASGSGPTASHLPSMGRHIFQLCTRGKGIRGLIPA